MNCLDCQEMLSEYIDGDLIPSHHQEISLHLDSCRECCSVQQDLEQIVQVSRNLPLLAPQNALWTKIEAEISELTQPPRQSSLWERFWGYRLQLNFSMPQLVSGLAGLAVIVGVGSTISYSPQQAINSSTTAVAAVRPAMNLEEAEVTGAIDRLSHTVQQRRTSWDPQLQDLFDRNLAIVERSVVDCKQMTERNPNDNIAHEMLLIAYQEKMRLLEQFSSL